MDNKQLHIVSFDVPSLPDYGGVIDVFYKIKALSEAGVEIILHCFHYGRKKSPELERYCSKVYYYPRGKGVNYLFSRLPYIVATRSSAELLKNLVSVDAPILFEGLHTCFFIDHPLLAGRMKIIRMHNVEHEYYNQLAADEQNLLRKIYYRMEAKKLKAYEKIVGSADMVATISPSDQEYFIHIHRNSALVPAFHSFEEITSKPGQGSYFLFHGNLSVNENRRAVLFLIDEVFNGLGQKLVIAGKNPGNEIIKKAAGSANIEVVANPEQKTMDELIANAQSCVLPTFQATGLKLKLLSSLFAGRFCITNRAMVANTGLENLCIIAENRDEFIRLVRETALADFSQEEINRRKSVLDNGFSNRKNAEMLKGFLNNKG